MVEGGGGHGARDFAAVPFPSQPCPPPPFSLDVQTSDSDVTASVLSGTSATLLGAYIPPHVLQPRAAYRFVVEAQLVWARGVVTASAEAGVVTAACPAGGSVRVNPTSGIAGVTRSVGGCCYVFSVVLRSRSISFTVARDTPKYTIWEGKGKGGRVGEGLVEGFVS